jgi:hypothetical protein
MSVKVMGWALEQVVGNATRKLILLGLADHADDRGVCYPSVATLARYAETSERTVQRNLSALEEDGFIRRGVRTRENGSQTSNQFSVVVPWFSQVSPGDKLTPPRCHSSVTPPGDKAVSPPEPSGGTTKGRKDLSAPADVSVAKNGRPPLPPHPPRVNVQAELARVRDVSFVYRDHPRYDEFGDAWEAYPVRATSESRREAFALWLKLVLQGVKPLSVLHACQRYAAEVLREGVEPKHVMMFATFLGPQARWEAYAEQEEP